MDRQRDRVWLARLAIVVLVIVAGCFLSGRWWWSYVNEPAMNPRVTDRLTIEENRIGEDQAGKNKGTELPNVQAHALDPVLQLARKALANHIASHRDYTANLIKQERVAGNLLPPSKMFLKLRYRETASKPAQPSDPSSARKVSVYLKTLEPRRQAGREVLWIEGENENKLKAHESGFLGLVTVDLPPASRLAMVGNRYPITEIGIERLLRKLIERGEQDKLLGPATVLDSNEMQSNTDPGELVVGNCPCRLIQIIHENPIVEYQGNEVRFEFHIAKIYIDMERLVPLKYSSYEWPKSPDGVPELIEEYTYEDLQLNVGLVDKDFDWKNPNYGF